MFHDVVWKLPAAADPQLFADAVGVAALILSASSPQNKLGTDDALEASVQVAEAKTI